MNFVVVLISMYLAAVLMNVFQIAKTYRELSNEGMWFTGYIYCFGMMFFHPVRVIYGTWRAIKDWDWLKGKIRLNENGEFENIKEDMPNA